MENWDKAAEYAAKVINCGKFAPYSIEELRQPAFVNAYESTSWIWGTLEYENSDIRSWPSHLCSFSGNSYAQVGMYKTINSRLYQLIPSTDVRKGWWVDEAGNSSILDSIEYQGMRGRNIAVNLGFYPFTNVKFGMKHGLGDNSNKCDWCLIRIEEMYFICAEAYAMKGDLSAGASYLNQLMANRDLSYQYVPTTLENFRNEIWKQRRIEFWGEGHSFADRMRLNKNMVRVSRQALGNVGNYYTYGAFNLDARDSRLLWPIPQSELDANPNLVQQPVSETYPLPFEGIDLKDGITDEVANNGMTYEDYLNSQNGTPAKRSAPLRVQEGMKVSNNAVVE